jgi:hypothetical protein
MSKMKNLKDGFAGATEHKMLQSVAVFKCYTMLHLNADMMTTKDQEKYMYDVYHGKLNICTSQVVLMLSGVGEYENLWILETNRSLAVKTIRYEFSVTRLEINKSFNEDSLRRATRNKPDHMSGRALLSRGKDIMRELKKYYAAWLEELVFDQAQEEDLSFWL